MTTPTQIALTVGPLALYLYLLGVWQSGRHPRVVSGAVDLGLLVAGVGGLLVFGPLGQTLVRFLFPAPSLSAWLALASGLVVATLLVLPRASRRWVIYNIEPDALNRTLRDVLEHLPGEFRPTLSGFEDPAQGVGLSVEASARWRTAVVAANGRVPEPLVRALDGALRARLGQVPAQPSGWSLVFFGLSTLILLVPTAQLLLTQPRAQAILPALLERLLGH